MHFFVFFNKFLSIFIFFNIFIWNYFLLSFSFFIKAKFLFFIITLQTVFFSISSLQKNFCTFGFAVLQYVCCVKKSKAQNVK